MLELDAEGAGITGKVQAGMTLVDGFAMGDLHNLVLRDRQHLANDGLVIIVVARSAQDGQIVGDIEIVFRGFAHAGDIEELTEKAKQRVHRGPDGRRR